MSIMQIPKFRVKNLQEQNDSLMITEKQNSGNLMRLGKATFPHISWRTCLKRVIVSKLDKPTEKLD